MALAAEARALLEELAAIPQPPLERTTPGEQRRIHLDGVRREPPPAPLERVEDISIPGPAGPLDARLYAPSGARLPGVLVYLHGGGWVVGTLETSERACRELARAAACAVVSVDYRLAPEHPFPAAVDDAYAATAWVAEQAGALGIDRGWVAVGGESAGGNLAAVAALLARDRGGPPLRLQLLAYPVTAYEFDSPSMREHAVGFGLEREKMRWYWDHYVGRSGDPLSPLASPLRAADLSGLPPALVITAEHDVLRDQGEQYADRLRAAGVAVECRRQPGTIHSFLMYSHSLERAANEGLGHCAAALRAAFGH